VSDYLAVPMEYSFTRAADAVWSQSAHLGLKSRDLLLAAASRNQMSAVELRAETAGTLQGWAGADTASFLFLYPLSGQVVFTMPGDERVTLQKRDVVHLPFLAAARDVHYSADFAAVEIAAPGGPIREVVPLLQIKRQPHIGGWEQAICRNRKEAYIQGDGPRSFFTYRNLGSAALTERRIQIHDGDGAVQPMAGGTGWHNHTMSQFFIVLDGEAMIDVEGHGSTRMVVGDTMTLGEGMRHNVSSYSVGYNVIEVCLPADYGTTAQTAPEG
jgi:mannose-6-phosphate isomerase-like protein (cupin superfamily)